MENLGITSFNKTFRGKKILITGHTGFKGSWLCMILSRLGADIYGYALAPPTEPSLYNIAKVDQLVNSTIADIRDYNQLSSFLKETRPEIVIHMAAQPLVRKSYTDPVETYAINVMGTVNLLEAIRSIKEVRAVLNVTTDKCYENKEWIWGYRENEPMGGYDPYSNSKACSELVTSSFRNSFFNPNNFGKTHQVALASARAGNVIGGGDWALDRLIPDFLKSVMSGEKVNIRNPHAIRPWQHVLEPLTGYLTLCARLCSEEGIRFAEGWNFGPDDKEAKNVEWIIKNMCSLWGENASYEIDPAPQPHEAGYLKLDSSKAANRLSWHPKWSTSETLSAIVDWTKAYQNGENMQPVCFRQIETYLNS